MDATSLERKCLLSLALHSNASSDVFRSMYPISRFLLLEAFDARIFTENSTHAFSMYHFSGNEIRDIWDGTDVCVR